MNRWLLFLLLLLAGTLDGQGQTLPPSRQAEADTARLGEVVRLGRHVQLTALPALAYPRHLRFFTAGSVLDCWQDQQGRYQGQFVQWVREVTPDKEAATQREFILTQSLTMPTVQALFAGLDSCQLLRVPDESAIRGWNRNILDGVAYTLEYRGEQTHQVANYSNPTSQGPLPEAQPVLRFLKQLDRLGQLRQVFGRAIPYQCWTNGSGTVVCRVVSYAQQAAYKRDRQRYRRQQAKHSPVKPTLP
ncbi:MAG: hypothetical protein EOO60_00470 [Hymenobacter sp.]|nr:MAG: hypothetical protein EOO60_00470 [Hymenobacter sp.]